MASELTPMETSAPSESEQPQQQAEGATPTASSSSSSPPPTTPTSNSLLSSIKVWKPPQGDGPTSSANLPDHFFEPTAGEIKAAFNSQVKTREKLSGGTLRTGVQREREEEARKKRSRYPQTRIRLRFADRTQVETTLSSSSGLAALYQFAKSVLSEEAKTKSFVLYQTPPKREFLLTDPKLKGKTLYDLQLTPASVIYIRFDDDSIGPAPLSQEYLAQAQDFPTQPLTPQNVGPNNNADSESSTTPSTSGNKGGARVPKWLDKLGKKK